MLSVNRAAGQRGKRKLFGEGCLRITPLSFRPHFYERYSLISEVYRNPSIKSVRFRNQFSNLCSALNFLAGAVNPGRRSCFWNRQINCPIATRSIDGAIIQKSRTILEFCVSYLSGGIVLQVQAVKPMRTSRKCTHQRYQRQQSEMFIGHWFCTYPVSQVSSCVCRKKLSSLFWSAAGFFAVSIR